jgi:hypothetical protein
MSLRNAVEVLLVDRPVQATRLDEALCCSLARLTVVFQNEIGDPRLGLSAEGSGTQVPVGSRERGDQSESDLEAQR